MSSDPTWSHIVPGAPSPGELIKAAITLKKVYDAFFSKHQNARAQVRDLVELVSVFSVNLANQGVILERAGKFFQGQEGFQRTIDQAGRFLDKFESLLETKPNKLKRIGDTTLWALEMTDEKNDIMNKLNLHVQAMNSFSLVTLLDSALHDRESSGSYSMSRRVSVENIDPAVRKMLDDFQDEYDHLYDEVILLQNRQKRVKHYDAVSHLNRVHDKWRELLLRTGVPEEQIPAARPLQDSRPGSGTPSITRQSSDSSTKPGMDTYGLALEHWKRALSASFKTERDPLAYSSQTPSRRTSMSYLRAQYQGTPSFTESYLSTPYEPASMSQTQPDSMPNNFGSSAVGRNSRRASEATSPISRQQTMADSVFTAPSPSGTVRTKATSTSLFPAQRPPSQNLIPDMESLNIQDGSTIGTALFGQHEIDLYKYDIQESQGKRAIVWNHHSPHEIRHFITSQKPPHPFTKHSRIKPGGLEVTFLERQLIYFSEQTLSANVNYHFKELVHCHQLQSAIYQRQLLHTFDVDHVSSASSKEASHQHAKIWKSNSSQRHYLTYFANAAGEPMHRELLFSWLEKPSSKKDGTVRVAVIVNPSAPGPSRQLMGMSIRRRSSRSTEPEPGSLSSESRRSSLAVVDPEATSIAPDVIQRLGHFEFKFHAKSEADRFLREVNDAHEQSRQPAVSRSPSLRVESPTTEQDEPQFPQPPPSSAARRRATPSSVLGVTVQL